MLIKLTPDVKHMWSFDSRFNRLQTMFFSKILKKMCLKGFLPLRSNYSLSFFNQILFLKHLLLFPSFAKFFQSLQLFISLFYAKKLLAITYICSIRKLYLKKAFSTFNWRHAALIQDPIYISKCSKCDLMWHADNTWSCSIGKSWVTTFPHLLAIVLSLS